MFMLLTQAWYETIFCGALEIGLDREKVHSLEDESFLYFEPTDEEPYEFQTK